MSYCNIHQIEFDLEEDGGCHLCFAEWVAPEDRDNFLIEEVEE